jgi:uncharacterized repeat protein (TIGR03803 family)
MRPKELCSGAKQYVIAALITLAVTTSAWAAREKVLHDFVDLPHGANPQANLIADSAGNFYGTTRSGGRYGDGTVFKLTFSSGANKWLQTILYSFRGAPNDGAFPFGGLTIDAAGNVYGATSGGTNFQACDDGCGTIFELSPSSGRWTETILYAFGAAHDGSAPTGNLVFDSAGNIYGTTEEGGASLAGTVFELSPSASGAWTERILHGFSGGWDGTYPYAGLIVDSMGKLYGTTEYGGDLSCDPDYRIAGCGVAFELTSDGKGIWSENILHTFTFNDGAFPEASLVFDTAGNLYGTPTLGPGVACGGGCGTVFKLTPNSDGTWVESILYNFEGGPDGVEPIGGLVLDGAGNLYGTTEYGGGSDSCHEGCGIVFELTPGSKGNWIEKVIHRFSLSGHGPNEGMQPVSSLFLDQAGNLYGTAPYGGGHSCYGFVGCGTVFELSPAPDGKWTSSLVYAFTTGQFGAGPAAGVISDSAGNLYGTTQGGGAANYGVVFELSPQADGSSKETVLHTFVAGSDGAHPGASLVFDAVGNLYGTTTNGGSQLCSDDSECGGTVFELSPAAHGWKESVLHRFGKNNNVGLLVPMGGVVLDSAGSLYGSTPEGGSTNCSPYGCGTIYKLSPVGGGKWHEEKLYLFQGGNDGSGPLSTLVFDQAGNLYGTTCSGGANGDGTVFRLAPNSSGKWTENVLYSFQGSQKNDGSCPFAGVIFDRDGSLYGTTFQGGNYENNCYDGGCGVVFELSPDGGLAWKEKVLHRFRAERDGSNPETALAIDGDGNLYGATPNDREQFGGGSVFRLSRSSDGIWTMEVLHHFKPGSERGFCPAGPLIFDAGGNVYGVASCGGTDGSGTVFQLSDVGDREWVDEYAASSRPVRSPIRPHFKSDDTYGERLLRSIPQDEVRHEK